MKNWKSAAGGQSGYSLTEMLVVVAMIGIFSLVTVPQFMTMYQQSKVRASVRQFNSHLRSARQRAITMNRTTAVSFAPGETPSAGLQRGQYGIYDRIVDTSTDPDTITWTLVGNWYRLEEPIYFLPSDFAVNSAAADTMHDVVFQPNGTISNLPGAGSSPTVHLKTSADIPNNHCTVTMNIAGSFSSVMSSD